MAVSIYPSITVNDLLWRVRRFGFADVEIVLIDDDSHGILFCHRAHLRAPRQIVFCETTLPKIPASLLDPMIAHELGHLHHRHIEKRTLLEWTGYFGLAITLALHVLFKSLWIAPIGALLWIGFQMGFLTWLAREWEHQADEFAVNMVGGDLYLRALRWCAKIMIKAPSRWSPHNHHPPLEQRLNRVEALWTRRS